MTWSIYSIQLTLGLLVLVLSSVVVSITAHGHHDSAPHSPGSTPIVPPRLVIAHFILQLLSWGILLPIGVILGLTRSKLHAPLQLITALISLPASTLPHLSSRHPYPENLHATLGSTFIIVFLTQISAGIFLKTHCFERSKFRSLVQFFHSILGKLFPILCWTQILLGGVASLSFCYGDHLGQCLAHFGMGSAFIGHGISMLCVLEFGKSWLKSHQISQEYLDSLVITTWGIVNTFTEHGFFFSAGWHWSHRDFQHTFLGVVWACAGGLGIYLSKNGRRSIMPGLVLIVTGWAFQSHQQSLEISTKIHGAFGFTLIAAGLSKTMGVLRDSGKRDPLAVNTELEAFDHLTPLLLTISGIMFMSAIEEQLLLIMNIGMDHATFVLCQVSIGCLIYLYTNLLIHLFKNSNSVKKLENSHVQLNTINSYKSSLEGQYENLSMENLLSPHNDHATS